MTTRIAPYQRSLLGVISSRRLARLGRRIILSYLNNLKEGRITLIEEGQASVYGQQTAAFPLHVELTVHDYYFYRFAAFGGSVGVAEAYMAGCWSTNDLTALIRIIIRNQTTLERIERGLARLMNPAYRLYHLLRKNTPLGSRKNIVAHYDLGNDFYKLFLDDTLTYSCGIFESETSTLRDAAIAKYDRICRKLQLSEKDHVLEIGTGWGGFAIHAVKNYGCRVTTTTISEEQFELAQRRFQAEKIEDRVTLLKKDYRQLEGQFDKLVSIEMIEAIGHHYLDKFLSVCSRCLKADGMMLLQAITMADWAYNQHKNSVDFIKRYIFPGSCIPSVSAISRSIAKKTDLRLFHLEDITPHYQRTLFEWRRRFFDNIKKIRHLGYTEPFIRMWEYYFCYCEAGFAERYIGDVQILFNKPLCRRDPILPRLSKAKPPTLHLR